MKKEKIAGFDLVRAICTIGIVLFHYSFNFIEYRIAGEHIFFARFANGEWGNMFVAMFFMLSGALLWYNHGESFNLPMFYLKRWLSIFPMFYLAWFPAYLAKVQELGDWLWAGPRSKFLYTVFGMDGYFMQLDPSKPNFNVNYYTLGEWFLGAIIILYVAFPALWLLFRRYNVTGTVIRHIFTVVLIAAFCANLYYDWWQMPAGKNLITCFLDFWAGMLLMEYYGKRLNKDCVKNIKKRITIFGGLFLFVAFFVPLGIEMNNVVSSLIVGAVFFVVLLNISDAVMRWKLPSIIIKYVSRWSFGVFLVHHVLIYAVMKQFENGSMSYIGSVGMFFVMLFIIMAAGGALSEIGNLITRWVLKLVAILGEKIKRPRID